MTLPAFASVLAGAYRSKRAYAEALRAALYADFPYVGRSYRPEAFVKAVADSNTTLRSVGAFCAMRTPRGYHPNTRIRAIVNFNLDQLLQKYTEARYGRSLLRTVERAAASPDPKRIPTYHVHGFLRFDDKAGNRKREAPDRVVLTEEDYYDAFGDPFTVFTYTVMHLLRETSFLFVGLSMSDDNLRRLLHYSKAERLRGYLAEGDSRRAARKMAQAKHFAVLCRPESPSLVEAQASSLARLGVAPLWVQSFDELPELLGEVYSHHGSWRDVYEDVV